jgi:Skp family chaperone for outer membrane proteins
MITIKRMKKMILVLVVGVALMLSIGCTKHPNEEQIRGMEETRSAALSAEQKLEEMKKQCDDLEKELAQKQQEAQKAKDQKAAVEQRLQSWSGN